MESKKTFQNQLDEYTSKALDWINLDNWSGFIEENLNAFRYLPYAVGALGLVVTFRGVRLATKFTHTSKVPKSFIRKHVELRGKIRDVSSDGSLQIDHKPIIWMPWHGFYREKYLDTKLAYVKPTVPGVFWMKLNMLGQPVNFRLLDRRDEVLVSTVKVQKKKLSLNEELVLDGRASLQIPERRELNRAEKKFVKQLESYERKAQKSGVGMWEKDVPENFLRKLLDKLPIRKKLASFIGVKT